MEKIYIVTFFVVLMVISCGSISACTGISASQNDVVLMGNNEDYTDPNTNIWFNPPMSGKYGCAYVGYNDFWAQGGINEKGLCFDGFGTPYNPYYIYNGDKPAYENGNLAERALEECQNISEVVNLFDSYFFPALKISQLFFADKEGNSVIIGGDVNLFKENNYQVCTNFFQIHPELGGYPCWRYNTAFQMLEQSNEISIDLFKNILDAVHVEGYYTTQYSNIYDIKNGLIYLYHFHNFERVIVLNLSEELEMGYHSYSIPSLFLDNYESPSKPLKPEGTSIGKFDNEYYYSTRSDDPNGDNLFYLFDWGDLSVEEWLGPFESGVVINISHIWDSEGEYNIRVKAKDTDGYESEWSDPLEVSMPKHKMEHPLLNSLFDKYGLFFNFLFYCFKVKNI